MSVHILKSLTELSSVAVIPQITQEQHTKIYIRPSMSETGPLGITSAVSTAFIEEVTNWLQARPNNNSTTEILYSSNQLPPNTLLQLGFLSQYTDCRWHLLDLCDNPRFKYEQPSLPITIHFPSISLSDHFLVLIGSLSTHPTERMIGCVATMLGLIPESNQADFRPMRDLLVSHLLKLWPPDLCILDARQVRRWDEVDSFDISNLDCLIVGKDPLAVDVAAARLLNLKPEEIPLLHDVRKAMRCPWPDVGLITPKINSPAPSRFYAQKHIEDRVARFTWQINNRTNRFLEKMNLPRIIGFARRVKEGK